MEKQLIKTLRENCAYMNACDCLKYGYGKKYWNACGLKDKEADNIWKLAKANMSRGY